MRHAPAFVRSLHPVLRGSSHLRALLLAVITLIFLMTLLLASTTIDVRRRQREELSATTLPPSRVATPTVLVTAHDLWRGSADITPIPSVRDSFTAPPSLLPVSDDGNSVQLALDNEGAASPPPSSPVVEDRWKNVNYATTASPPPFHRFVVGPRFANRLVVYKPIPLSTTAEPSSSSSSGSYDNSAAGKRNGDEKADDVVTPCSPFILTETSTLPRFNMCVSTFEDVISSFVIRDGYWRDCLPLVALATLMRTFSSPTLERDYTVLDIGANMGTCSTLLAARGFFVTALEPVRLNQQVLMQTVHVNAQSLMGHRIQLIGAAASREAGIAEIAIEVGNAGNAAILRKHAATSISTFQRSGTSRRENITMLRLDDLLADSSAPLKRKNGASWARFHLVKLDCQGSELPALLGGEREILVHQAADLLYIEMDTRLSRAVGYDLRDIFLLLHRHRYQTFYSRGRRVWELLAGDDEALAEFVESCVEFPKDVVAVAPRFVKEVGLLRLFHVMTTSAVVQQAWITQEHKWIHRLPRKHYLR